MHTAAYFIVTLIFATALYFGIRWLVTASSKYRGSRVVACRETGRPALVEVDALHASLTSVVGRPDIRLENCSRWPLKNQCGQECLANLDVAPGECLVSGVLMKWYRGKNCIYCGKPAEELHWVDYKPALQAAESKLVEWHRVPVAKLPMVLETHLPVCWDCYISRPVLRGHAELVYRPLQHNIPGGPASSSPSRHLQV